MEWPRVILTLERREVWSASRLATEVGVEIDQILALLAIVYVSGRVGAEISERLRQPPVVGVILVGVVLGPSVFGVVPAHNETLDALAELGVIFLLFSVGLETDVRELRRVGGTAISVAAAGVILPFALGAGLMMFFGPIDQALFVGVAMVATSVGITAEVLRAKGKLNTREARIILGAAVADDILTLLILGVVTAFAAGEVRATSILLIAAAAISFVVVVGTFGRRLMSRLLPRIDRLKMDEPALGVTIAIALGLAASAGSLGLAPIVGAFLAGIVLGEGRSEFELEQKTLPLATFFVPFFFIHVGSRLEIDQLITPKGLLLVGSVTVLAFIGKFVGGGLASLRLGKRSAAIIGVGMVPRGEVGIVVASLALANDVVDQQIYGVVVAMSVITSLVAPPILNVMFKKNEKEAPAG